ncbi:MAG: nucleoside phosphorylase [Thermoplasmataceae archaeon]
MSVLNRYLPKVPNKVRHTPKFTAEDSMRISLGDLKSLPESCVMVFSKPLYDKLQERLRTEEIRYPYDGFYQESVNAERNLIVIRIPPGAPLAVATVEELVSLGVRKFLILGTAGSISTRANFNDIVLCTKAVRDEGTSYHYIRPSTYAYPSKPLTRSLLEALKKKGMMTLSGPSWTTDAPYMETIEEISEFRRRGVITVEMEAASVFAVSVRRNVESAAVFSISDELHGESWTGIRIPETGFTKLAEVAEVFGGL